MNLSWCICDLSSSMEISHIGCCQKIYRSGVKSHMGQDQKYWGCEVICEVVEIGSQTNLVVPLLISNIRMYLNFPMFWAPFYPNPI